MAKILELQFLTDNGKVSKISIDSPKEPIDTVLIKQAMEQIIAADIFDNNNGKFVSVKGARVVDRNIVDYELS